MRPLLLILTLLGCPKTTPPAAAPDPATVPHDLPCPDGTIPLGAAPPKGLDAWCSRTLHDGEKVRTGPSMTWHTATIRASDGWWYDDKKRGEWRYWHPNGQIEKVEYWRDGKLHGPYTEYDPDGQKRVEGAYLGDAPAGTWTWWSADGWMERTGAFAEGEKDGEWLEYDADGKLVSRRVFRVGRQLSQQFFVDEPTPVKVPADAD